VRERGKRDEERIRRETPMRCSTESGERKIETKDKRGKRNNE
jgi:hypothetical protein